MEQCAPLKPSLKLGKKTNNRNESIIEVEICIIDKILKYVFGS